ncbi:lipopolysaccharide biosynthesis protein [Lysobacter xanthus]
MTSVGNPGSDVAQDPVAEARPTVARSQAYLLLAQVARVVLFLLVTRQLGRDMEAADFGFFALVSTMFALALQVMDMGSTAVATRQIGQQPAIERELLEALLGWRLLLGTVMAVGCLLLALFGPVRGPEERAVLAVAGIGVFLLHQSSYFVVFQLRQQFGRALLLGLGSQIGFLLASLVLLRMHVVAVVVALLVVVRETVQVLGSRLIAIRLLGYPLRPRLRSPALRPLLAVAWPFGLCAVIYKLAFHGGTFFVWMLETPDVLGTLGATLRLFSPVIDAAWLFVTPLIVGMSVAARTDTDVFRNQLSAYLCLLLGVAGLLAVCGSMLAPTLLRMVYGDRYVLGELSSVATFQWCSAATALSLVTPAAAIAMLAQHREKELLWISAAGLGLNMLVCAWAIPRHGAAGAAMATFATEAFIVFGLLGRLYISGDWRPSPWLVAHLLPAALVASALLALAPHPQLRLPVAALMGLVSVLAMWQLPAQKKGRRGIDPAAMTLVENPPREGQRP